MLEYVTLPQVNGDESYQQEGILPTFSNIVRSALDDSSQNFVWG